MAPRAKKKRTAKKTEIDRLLDENRRRSLLYPQVKFPTC